MDNWRVLYQINDVYWRKRDSLYLVILIIDFPTPLSYKRAFGNRAVIMVRSRVLHRQSSPSNTNDHPFQVDATRKQFALDARRAIMQSYYAIPSAIIAVSLWSVAISVAKQSLLGNETPAAVVFEFLKQYGFESSALFTYLAQPFVVFDNEFYPQRVIDHYGVEISRLNTVMACIQSLAMNVSAKVIRDLLRKRLPEGFNSLVRGHQALIKTPSDLIALESGNKRAARFALLFHAGVAALFAFALLAWGYKSFYSNMHTVNALIMLAQFVQKHGVNLHNAIPLPMSQLLNHYCTPAALNKLIEWYCHPQFPQRLLGSAESMLHAVCKSVTEENVANLPLASTCIASLQFASVKTKESMLQDVNFLYFLFTISFYSVILQGILSAISFGRFEYNLQLPEIIKNTLDGLVTPFSMAWEFSERRYQKPNVYILNIEKSKVSNGYFAIDSGGFLDLLTGFLERNGVEIVAKSDASLTIKKSSEFAGASAFVASFLSELHFFNEKSAQLKKLIAQIKKLKIPHKCIDLSKWNGMTLSFDVNLQLPIAGQSVAYKAALKYTLEMLYPSFDVVEKEFCLVVKSKEDSTLPLAPEPLFAKKNAVLKIHFGTTTPFHLPPESASRLPSRNIPKGPQQATTFLERVRGFFTPPPAAPQEDIIIAGREALQRELALNDAALYEVFDTNDNERIWIYVDSEFKHFPQVFKDMLPGGVGMATHPGAEGLVREGSNCFKLKTVETEDRAWGHTVGVHQCGRAQVKLVRLCYLQEKHGTNEYNKAKAHVMAELKAWQPTAKKSKTLARLGE